MIGPARYRLYFNGAPGGGTQRLSQAQTFLLILELLYHTDILSLSGSCRTEMSTTSTSAKWPRMQANARATCGSFIYSVTVTAYAPGA
jgi:hypothetical protein